MIVARKLTKDYPGEIRALDSLTVVIPQGEFAFLVGPNGAGKTTLFKLITREEPATSGCILLDGRNVTELRARELASHRRVVGTVFQDARLIPSKTVFENLALPLEAKGLDQSTVQDRADAAIFLAGLGPLAKRFPGDLSGGQRQQVAIARALANRPRVILADEPTGNLSPAATDQIMHLLALVNECGITVIVATHNFDVVNAMNRRVIALARGRLVSDTMRGSYPDTWKTAAAA